MVYGIVLPTLQGGFSIAMFDYQRLTWKYRRSFSSATSDNTGG